MPVSDTVLEGSCRYIDLGGDNEMELVLPLWKKNHKTLRGHQRQRSRGNIERLSGPKKAWRMLRRMLMGLGPRRQVLKERIHCSHSASHHRRGTLKPSDQLSWVGIRGTLDFTLLSVSGKTIRDRRIGKLAQHSPWEGGIRPIVPQGTCLLSLKSCSAWFTYL